MKTFFPRFARVALVVTGTAVLAGCSKNESSTTASTPSPTPSATVSETAAPAVSPAVSPAATGSPFADVNLRLRDLESRMDSIFADAFQHVGPWFDQSQLASSVDLREENDKYVARLYLPHADTSKVDARVENGALRITAHEQQTTNGKSETEQFDQLITLAKPVQADKVHVDKKQNVVVITVPKTAASAPAVAKNSPAPAVANNSPAAGVASNSPAPNASASPWASPADSDTAMFQQLARMQSEMDQEIHKIFQNDFAEGASTSQLGSAVNVDDQKDKYVVHFYLPDQKASDVDVKFQDGQLRLTAEEKNNNTSNTTANGTTQSSSAARYEEMLTLPGPVKQNQMTVDRKAGSVVVTLPKA